MNDLSTRLAQLDRIGDLLNIMTGTRGDSPECDNARADAARAIAEIVGGERGHLQYELGRFEREMAPASADAMTTEDFIAEGWNFPGHRAPMRLSNRVAVTVFEAAA